VLSAETLPGDELKVEFARSMLTNRSRFAAFESACWANAEVPTELTARQIAAVENARTIVFMVQVSQRQNGACRKRKNP
jgi:hypothetical protein